MPQVLNASLPWQDELGLWVDLDVEYNGVCQATVETKGLRLPGKDEPDPEAQALARLFSRQGHLDSDEEDSAEEDDDTGPLADGSASDDNDDGTPNLHPHAGGRLLLITYYFFLDFKQIHTGTKITWISDPLCKFSREAGLVE